MAPVKVFRNYRRIPSNQIRTVKTALFLGALMGINPSERRDVMTEYGIMMMWCFLGPFIGFLIGGMWESQKHEVKEDQ